MTNLFNKLVTKSANIFFPKKRRKVFKEKGLSNINSAAISQVRNWLKQDLSNIFIDTSEMDLEARRLLGEPRLVTRDFLIESLQKLLDQRKNVLNSKIRTYFKELSNRLDEQVRTAPSVGIACALSRDKMWQDLDRARKSDGTYIFEPQKVKEAISEEAQNLFSDNDLNSLENILDEWKEYFEPLDNIQEMSLIWNKFSNKEIKETLFCTNQDKAPGLSGITVRMIKMLGKIGIKALKRIFNSIISSVQVPDAWKKTVILFLPKSDELDASLFNMRPISLIEVALKLFMKMLLNRMTRIILKNYLLTGADCSATPGSSTTFPILALASCLNDSKVHNRELHVFLEDKSKAFDKISHKHLKMALARIGAPSNLIDFYCNIWLSSRVSCVRTSFGLSPFFNISRGVPQGGPESPLFFTICYDPLLVRLKHETLGYSIRNCQPRSNPTFEELKNCVSYENVKLTSFMDDLCLISESKNDLQNQLSIVSSYNSLVGMVTNLSKSSYVHFNCSLNDPILLDDQEIHPVDKFKKLRLLGVYFSEKNGLSESKSHALNCAKEAINAISRFKMSPFRFKYLINHVVYPAISYITQFAPLNQTERDSINKAIRNACRKMFRLPTALPRCFFHGTPGLGILDYDSVQLQASTTLIAFGFQKNAKEFNLLDNLLTLLQHSFASEFSPFEFPELKISLSKHIWAPLIPLWAQYKVSLPLFNRSSPSPSVSTLPKFSGLHLSARKKYGIYRWDDIFQHRRNLLNLQKRSSPQSSKVSKEISLILSSLNIQFDSNVSARISKSYELFLCPFGTFTQIFSFGSPIDTYVLQHVIPGNSIDSWTICNQKDCPLRVFHPGSENCIIRVSSLENTTFLGSSKFSFKNLGYVKDSWDSISLGSERSILQKVLFQMSNSFFKQVDQVHQSLFSDRLENRIQKVFPHAKIEIFNRMNYDFEDTRIWSDGSKIDFDEAVSSLGASAIIRKHHKEIRIYSKLENLAASSYHAELCGVIMGLLALEKDESASFFVDNLAVVCSFRNISSRYYTIRKKMRTAAPFLWSIVQRIIRENNLTINIKWIKGHSGIRENELADFLAGRAHSTNEIIEFTGIKKQLGVQQLLFNGTQLDLDPGPVLRRIPIRRHFLVLNTIIQKRFGDLINDLVYLPSVMDALKPPESQKQLAIYRFRVRTLFGFLPTPELATKMNNRSPPSSCPKCLSLVIPDDRHATSCAPIPSSLIFGSSILSRLHPIQIVSGVFSQSKLLEFRRLSLLNSLKFQMDWNSYIYSNVQKIFNTSWKPFALCSSLVRYLNRTNTPRAGSGRVTACYLCQQYSECSCNQFIVDVYVRQAGAIMDSFRTRGCRLFFKTVTLAQVSPQ